MIEIFLVVFMFMPFVAVPIIMISLIVRAKKKIGTENKQNKEIDNNIDEQKTQTGDTVTYCEYCGNMMYRTEKKCSSCGAKKKNIK